MSDAQYGPHRFSAGEHSAAHTDEFRGVQFVVRDLRGARFVDCDLSGVVVRDGVLAQVDLSGWVDGLVVNGVDVTGYVEAELDRRHPERVQLREIRSADGFRAMWRTLEGLWADLDARVDRLGEAAARERVAGEWSYVETLRHLVLITDAWFSRTVLDQESPYDAIGLAPTWYPDPAAVGLDPAADPTLAQVRGVLAQRRALVRDHLATVEDSGLGRECDRRPLPGFPPGPRPVFECLAVLCEEEVEHLRFATRDVAVLESREPA